MQIQISKHNYYREPKKRKRRQTPAELQQAGVDAVIQLTGGVLQSLFGVAYTDDVRKVVDRIDKIDDDLRDNISVVKSSQENLQRKTTDTLSKQDNTILMVEKMARTVERKVRLCPRFKSSPVLL